MLHWYDMVPVLNWFYLRGRCRNCKEPISFRYPAVELLGGLFAMACFFQYGMSLKFLLYFAFLCMLTMIGFIDHDTMEIPNELSFLILVIGIVDCFAGEGPALMERIIGMLVVSIPMLLLALLIPGAFGGGDIKLMAAAGLLLGWKLTLLSAFLAIVSGGFYGIFLLASQKAGRKEHFAFGPFLCVGMAVALFAGNEILNWYLGFFRF
jgi:leader peptidase (prepilin peptidase)/N-methyltransferase